MDQYSGEIPALNTQRDFAAGDTVLSCLHPLHSGEAFDLPGRLLVRVAELACPLLFATGVIRWLQKRRARLPRY